MDLGLQGRHAVVTGASKGIGLACAKALAAEGCTVTLVSRDAGRLAEAQKLVGSQAQVFAADLSKAGDRVKLAAAVPAPDILVNNAGAIPGGNILGLSMETWQEA